jgi:hypothetical protein
MVDVSQVGAQYAPQEANVKAWLVRQLSADRLRERGGSPSLQPLLVFDSLSNELAVVPGMSRPGDFLMRMGWRSRDTDDMS